MSRRFFYFPSFNSSPGSLQRLIFLGFAVISVSTWHPATFFPVGGDASRCATTNNMSMNQPMPLAIRNDDDQKLALRARDGCRESFGLLVTRHHIAVRNVLWKIIGREDDVDDVAQEVFMSALRSIPKIRLESSFRTWLVSITRNTAITHLRKRQQKRETAFDQIERILGDVYESQLTDHEFFENQLDSLKQCLERLAPPHRALIQQTYFDERTPTDLAEQIGTNPGTVRMRLMRIRRALADCIQDNQEG